MNIDFSNTFFKDLTKIKNKKIISEIDELINEIEISENLNSFQNIKKLTGYKDYYRIKIQNYRLGIKVTPDKISFMRVLQRKDIYRFFP